MKILFFAAITILLAVACKKDSSHPTTPPPAPTTTATTLHSFTVSLVDTGTTAATIQWTSAGDSTGVHYSVFLNSAVAASNLKQLRYAFTHLTPDTTYAVEVRVYNAANDSLASKLTFATKDTYFTFAKMIMPDAISYDLALTPEQGYLMTVYNGKNSMVNGVEPLSLLKTDSGGNVLWVKNLGYQYDARQAKITPTAAGYFIGGYNYLIKVDSGGNILWNSVQTNGYQVNAIRETVDGSLFTAASTPTTAAVMKFNSTGGLLWSKTYWDTARYPWAIDLVETPDHNFAVLGTENLLFTLWKVDAQGNVIWKTDFGNGYAFPTQLKLVNNTFMAGGYWWGGRDASQMVTYRLDMNGNFLNQHPIMYPEVENIFENFELTSDGGYVVAADVYNGNATNISVLKYDANDQLQWQTVNSNFAHSYAIKQTADGGYVEATTYQDLWLLKMNPKGEIH